MKTGLFDVQRPVMLEPAFERDFAAIVRIASSPRSRFWR
jgi:hypothetical protein